MSPPPRARRAPSMRGAALLALAAWLTFAAHLVIFVHPWSVRDSLWQRVFPNQGAWWEARILVYVFLEPEPAALVMSDFYDGDFPKDAVGSVSVLQIYPRPIPSGPWAAHEFEWPGMNAMHGGDVQNVSQLLDEDVKQAVHAALLRVQAAEPGRVDPRLPDRYLAGATWTTVIEHPRGGLMHTALSILLLLPALLATLFLAFSAWRRWRWSRRTRRGLCPACAYDLAGALRECPECGLPAAANPASLPPTDH